MHITTTWLYLGRRIFACLVSGVGSALTLLSMQMATAAPGPDLTGTRWAVSPAEWPDLYFLDGKPGRAVKITVVEPAYGTREEYYQDGYGWDGTYDGKHLVFNQRRVSQGIGESFFFDGYLNADGTRFTGSITHHGGGVDYTEPAELRRIGALSTTPGISSPSDLWPYLKRILGVLLGALALVLALMQIAKASKGDDGKEPAEYLLDVRTVDGGTTLNADGQDVLWVYGIVLSTNPSVNATAVTSTLKFIAQGPNAPWLIMGAEQMVGPFKVVPVRAWPPTPDSEGQPGGPTIVVSTVVEGNVLTGSVPISLQRWNLEVLDANGIVTGFPGEADSQSLIAKSARANESRMGAAADGVSVLLLRMKSDVDGQASFALEGADALGTLHALGTNPWAKPGTSTLDVSTARDGKEYWVFALYRPPRNFPGRSYFPDCSYGVFTDRQFKVKATFTTPDGQQVEMAVMLKLVPPPLVLVHGTYDDPYNCWQVPLNSTVDPYHTPMAAFLKQSGLHEIHDPNWHGGGGFSMVDWKKTSGMEDPSGFGEGFGICNWRTVWENPSGIKDALDAYRKKGIAATQADLVCHSQGGLIARVYTIASRPVDKLDDRYNPSGRRAEHRATDEDHLHLTAPYDCAVEGYYCEYHRADNFYRGDIHKMITISTTHMGSDLPRLLQAFIEYKEESWTIDPVALWTGLFLGYVNTSNAVYSQAFKDQIPGSFALERMGATVVPAHAIACVAYDEDLPTVDNGFYEDRMSKVWEFTPKEVMQWAFEHLHQPNDAERLAQLDADEKRLDPAGGISQSVESWVQLGKLKKQRRAAFRAAVFGHRPNDCTVRLESSLGGLTGTYTSVLDHVLHGYAPRYEKVQLEVARLLDAPVEGPDFCLTGFPDAFADGGAWVTGPGRSNDGPPD